MTKNNFEKRIKDRKINRRNFLKIGRNITLGTALSSFYGCPKTINNDDDDNGIIPEIGNLTGRITGLFKKAAMGNLTVSLRGIGKVYEAQTDANGNFEIKGIENPTNYDRIRIRGSDIIDRETNIRLGKGENNASDIDVIEEDNITGFNYEDYLTVNSGGIRIVSSIPLKHYFFNQSVWEGDDWGGYVKVGTLESLGAEEYTTALTHIKDVYTNDFPQMTRNVHTDTEILLESEGKTGPASINYEDIKDGWLVSCITKGIWGFRTSTHSNDDFEINGARLRMAFREKQPPYHRGGFAEDICEWAGFVDFLEKSDYSIFSDTDNGSWHGENLYPFDKEYAAVIKYNRATRHGSNGDIPDYDHVGGTSIHWL